MIGSDGRRGRKPRGELSGWGLALVAVAAFGMGTMLGLVSNWVDSLRAVALGVFSLAFLVWLGYCLAPIFRGGRRRGALAGPVTGMRILAGPVLALALGLAAADDVTASLVLVIAFTVVCRMRMRGRARLGPTRRR